MHTLCNYVSCKEGSSILTLLSSIKDEYNYLVSSSKPSMFFHSLRERVWTIVRQDCPSFRPMDCNAQFSELFNLKLLNGLSAAVQQKSLLTSFLLKGNCLKCCKEVTSTVIVFVHYITIKDLVDNHLDLHSWSSLIVKNNENSLVQCSSCENSSRCEDFHTYLSDILFIELNPAAMGTINFSQEIKVVDETYILHALVRNSGAHFSCALQLNEGWELYDAGPAE